MDNIEIKECDKIFRRTNILYNRDAAGNKHSTEINSLVLHISP